MKTAISSTFNRALWLAPALALFGFFSYFFLLVRWPLQRDSPVLSYVILAAAVALATRAVREAMRTRARRIRAWLLWPLPLCLMVLLYLYCSTASRLPAATAGGLQIGQAVPALVLEDEAGRAVKLEAAMGPSSVLIFYRGSWCLFCRSELADFEAHRAELDRLGTTLIGISSESSAIAKKLRADLALGYPLLADSKLNTIVSFGVRHEEHGKQLDWPLPALFVVQNGIVREREISTNYRLLPHAAEVVRRVRAMRQP